MLDEAQVPFDRAHVREVRQKMAERITQQEARHENENAQLASHQLMTAQARGNTDQIMRILEKAADPQCCSRCQRCSCIVQ